jgi:phosphoserine aminotransferase
MKKHNFYAGPSILSDFAIEETSKALFDLDGSGVSLACISHRSKEFDAVMTDAQELMKEILGVPDGYHVLYLQGGASLQFCMIPYNLMKSKAVYLNTGSWAQKAIKEAKFFGEVEEIKGENNFSLPKDIQVDSNADYFHFTSNNTIFGTEIVTDFDLPIPVTSDMSSDILSRPIDVSKYGIIYGGAQKNLGPAGVAFVIIKEDILGKIERQIPTMLDYKTHISKGSLFNTPPCIAVYTVLQTLKWVQKNDGVKTMEQKAIEKSSMLYEEIDRNPLFIPTVKNKEDRSKMNVCFVMAEKYKNLDKEFLDFASSKDIVGIKGHRSVGGFRASLYNALPMESVETLINCMKEFAEKKA